MEPEDIVKEIVKANATEAYKDSAQPAVRVLGKSLAQCISLFATPMGRMAEIFEKNIHRYLDKLDGIDEDQLIEPDTRVVVPILEKLRYIEDEKVADYYTEILASASRKDQKGRVALSYIEILNRVTADELKILEYINSTKNKIDISGISKEEKTKYNIIENIKFINLIGSLPVLDVKLLTEKEAGFGGYRLIMKNFNILSKKISLDNPDNINSYLDNLISLGLLHKPFGEYLALKPIYNHLKNHPKIILLNKQLGNGQKLDLDEKKIELTDLCKNMLALCHKRK